MSDVPNIFVMPGASWSDRTTSPVETAALDAARALRTRQRLVMLGAAATAWGLFGLVAGLIWFAAA